MIRQQSILRVNKKCQENGHMMRHDGNGMAVP